MKSFTVNKIQIRDGIFWGIILLFAFYPAYFEHIPIIAQNDMFINLIIMIGISFYLVKVHKINYSILFIILFVFIQLLSTSMNHGYMAGAVWGRGILLFVFCVGIQYFYKKDEKRFLSVGYWLFYTLVITNVISLILFPQGMFEDARGIKKTNFFLGNYNGFIIYIFIAIIIGYLYQKNQNKKYTIHYLVLWFFSFFSYYKTYSVTSMMGLFLLAFYMFFLNHKWTRWIFNIKTYVLVNLVFFYTCVWNSMKGVFLSSVMALIKKDITFTGRTLIWENTKPYICENWLLGNGFQIGEVMIEQLGSSHAVNPHNLYLDLLYKTGILGFGVIVILTGIVLFRLKKLEDQKVRYFLEAFIGVFMFMSQFEAYNIKFIFFMLVFFYMYASKNSGEVGKTGVSP